MGVALHGGRDADLVAAHRQHGVIEAGAGKQRAGRRHAEAHGDRHRFVLLVVFVDHLPHVRAGRDLERADIAPAEIHAVVAEVGAAIELRAGDAADAGADGQLGLVGGVADRHQPFVYVVGLLDHVLLARRLALRDLHGLERMRQRMRELAHPLGVVLPAEHAVDDRHVAEQIGDDAMIGLALDVVEQDRAAAIHVLLQPGDLKVGIDFLVGLDQLAVGAQPLQRAAQIESLVRRRGGLLVPCAGAVALVGFPLHRFLSNYLHGNKGLSTPMPPLPSPKTKPAPRAVEFPPRLSSGYLVRDAHRAFQRLLERRIAALRRHPRAMVFFARAVDQ